MTAVWQLLDNTHLDSHFFQQFSPKALLSRLSWFDLPSGEFPFERHTHDLAPLGREYKAIVFNDGAGYMNVTVICQLTGSSENHRTACESARVVNPLQ